MQVEVPSSPDSATRGDIVVTVLEEGGDEWWVWRLDTDEWDGEWRRSNRLGSYNGTRAELVLWAMAQDTAARGIFDEETSDLSGCQTSLARTRSIIACVPRASSRVHGKSTPVRRVATRFSNSSTY